MWDFGLGEAHAVGHLEQMIRHVSVITFAKDLEVLGVEISIMLCSAYVFHRVHNEKKLTPVSDVSLCTPVTCGVILTNK